MRSGATQVTINRAASGRAVKVDGGPRLAPGVAGRHIDAMQSDNPVLDGLARLFTDAAGAAQSVRSEIDTFMRQRLERLVADMDFVPREEFDAVKAMAAKARSENERLEARLAELEARLGAAQPAGDKSVS